MEALYSNVYVDESSQSKHRYLVLGGVIVPVESDQAFHQGFAEARLPELPQGELKWGKVSKGKCGAYQRVIDFFFDHQLAGHWHFHSMVVDTSKLRDGEFNRGSREIGFNKELYQLAMKFRRLYPQRLLHLYPDHRDTFCGTEELQDILNAGARKARDRRHDPFRRVHFRKSDQCPPIQLVDLFTGALAYRLNGHDVSSEASSAKKLLAEHVLDRAGISTPHRDSAISGKFTIWHRQLR